MATKIIFRRVKGRIVPMRVDKHKMPGDRYTGFDTIQSVRRKQLRQKAGGGFGKRKGRTGFYADSTATVTKGHSVIPRRRGGVLVLGNDERRFGSVRETKRFLKGRKKPGIDPKLGF